jgi:hypothetical protein
MRAEWRTDGQGCCRCERRLGYRRGDGCRPRHRHCRLESRGNVFWRRSGNDHARRGDHQLRFSGGFHDRAAPCHRRLSELLLRSRGTRAALYLPRVQLELGRSMLRTVNKVRRNETHLCGTTDRPASGPRDRGRAWVVVPTFRRSPNRWLGLEPESARLGAPVC